MNGTTRRRRTESGLICLGFAAPPQWMRDCDEVFEMEIRNVLVVDEVLNSGPSWRYYAILRQCCHYSSSADLPNLIRFRAKHYVALASAVPVVAGCMWFLMRWRRFLLQSLNSCLPFYNFASMHAKSLSTSHNLMPWKPHSWDVMLCSLSYSLSYSLS